MKINLKEKIDNVVDLLKSLQELITSAKKLWVLVAPGFGIIIALFRFDKFKNILIRYNILSESAINFISSNSNGLISILLVIVLIILVLTIRKAGEKELETNSNTYNIINKLHYEFAHRLRDGIYNLYVINKRISELREKNNADAILEVQARAYDNLILDLQAFVDLIADCLSSYNHDTISVCIKTINPGQENIANEEKKAKTLVRSKNTKRDRKRNNENITLGKNSDFKHLCDGTNIWYHGIDLKSKYEKHEYENEADEKDWQSKYNSTIVVPIRYYNIDENTSVNDILGFLCIDSKNIVKSWDDIESFELQYLAIFADSIYTYIKLFRRLF